MALADVSRLDVDITLQATEKTLWVLVSLASLSIATFVANIYLAVDIGRVIGVSTGYADPLKVSDWAFPLWVYASLVLSLALTSIRRYMRHMYGPSCD